MDELAHESAARLPPRGPGLPGLWTSLCRLSLAPKFVDEHEQAAASLANAVLWVSLIGPLVYLVGTLHMPVSWPGRAPLLVAIAIPIVCLRALRRGYLRAACTALVMNLVIVAIWGALASGGVRAPSVMVLFIAVYLAGQLLGVGAALGTALLAVLAVAALAELAGAERLPWPRVLHSDRTYAWAMAIEIAAIGACSALSARLSGRMVSGLRRKQQELRDAHGYIQETLEASPDGIISLNPNGTVLQANRAYEVLVGAPRAEICGRHFLASVSMSDEDKLLATKWFERVLAGEKSVLMSTQLKRRDGSDVAVEANPRLIRRADGTRTVEIVVRDVTARLAAERRERELEAQLDDARRLEYIGRLSGGVAHDFNNLLTVMLGDAELGRQSRDLAEARRWFDDLTKTGERASELTRQLLAVVRRKAVEPRILDLAEHLRGMQGFLRRILPTSVALVIEADDRVNVNADPAQLDQIVVNLVTNARDAMPDGGRLSLRLTRQELSARRGPLAPGRYAILAVIDTGAGMDEATRRHVFEPFFTTKPKGQGTGLGLATVLGIAAQSGGHVFATSAPGQGTAFEVYLPAVDKIPNPERPPARRENESGSGTIVVVEDQAAVRQVVVRALRGHGFKVFEAGDAAEAFALVERTGAPNLLLSDLVLPNESGLALAKRLRRVHPELPVLFMSADAERILANETPLPASDFIAKPFRPEDLVARVRTLIDGKGAPDAAAPGA